MRSFWRVSNSSLVSNNVSCRRTIVTSIVLMVSIIAGYNCPDLLSFGGKHLLSN